MQDLYLKAIKLNKNDPRSYYGLYLLDQNNLTDENISLLNDLKNRDLPLNESYLVEYLLSKIAKKEKNMIELDLLNNFQKQCFKLEVNSIFYDIYYKRLFQHNIIKLILLIIKVKIRN